MSPSLWNEIIEQIESSKVKYGFVRVEFTVHEGRIKHYVIVQGSRHNIDLERAEDKYDVSLS
jgi:hypothetical protein